MKTLYFIILVSLFLLVSCERIENLTSSNNIDSIEVNTNYIVKLWKHYSTIRIYPNDTIQCDSTTKWYRFNNDSMKYIFYNPNNEIDSTFNLPYSINKDTLKISKLEYIIEKLNNDSMIFYYNYYNITQKFFFVKSDTIFQHNR